MRRKYNPIYNITLFLLLLVCLTIPSAALYASEPDQFSEISQPASEQQPVSSGWLTEGAKTYYLDASGRKAKGLKKIEGSYYYFSNKGVLKTGWVKVKGKKCYFDPGNGGARASGIVKIGRRKYCLKKNGSIRTGWFTAEDGNRYYFDKNGRMKKGWLELKNKRYYLNKTTGVMSVGETNVGGKTYCFSEKGVLLKQAFAEDGSYYDEKGVKLKQSTIKEFLQTALLPVGSTMYIWGGGWNEADDGAGVDAVTIGVSPTWKQFFEKQGSGYDYRNTRYQIRNGLDCSGYVGWAIYNAFNTTSGNAGYVMLAEKMSGTFAKYGWGSCTPAGSVKDFKAGDIMSTASGHVYIVVGSCSDGSVVLMHSSPQGVMISGTATRSGSESSEAVALAAKYMKTYYPNWYAKYPKVSRGTSYLTGYAQMRWYVSGQKHMMTDPEHYQGKDAATILKDLFGEKR